MPGAGFEPALYLVWAIFQLAPLFFRGAPFVATGKKRLKTMMELAALKAGEKTVDLGSGDGRFIVAAARQGCRATGYELNLLLVLYSRWCIRRAGLKDRAEIKWADLWQADLSDVDVIFIYGLDTLMTRLSRTVIPKLKSGTRIVSSGFELPGWRPNRQKDRVFLYTMVDNGHKLK